MEQIPSVLCLAMMNELVSKAINSFKSFILTGCNMLTVHSQTKQRLVNTYQAPHFGIRFCELVQETLTTEQKV